MAPNNPFLAEPRLSSDITSILSRGGWDVATHELPMLALEIEWLIHGNSPSFSPSLQPYVAWLSNNSAQAPSLLWRTRIGTILPEASSNDELGSRLCGGERLSSILQELFGIPPPIAATLETRLEELPPKSPARPWIVPRATEEHRVIKEKLQKLGAVLLEDAAWNTPFCAVTANRNAFVFASDFSPEHPLAQAKLRHELEHIVHLMSSDDDLANISPWTRELAATTAEYHFVCEFNRRDLLREWKRQNLIEGIRAMREDLIALKEGAPICGARLPLSSALYSGATIALEE